MKSYFLDEFEDKKTYIRFVKYMLLHSDSFSLVYFKYTENEKEKTTVKEIKNLLKAYKIFAINGNQWPSTATLNVNNHIYKIVLYKADLGAEAALSKAEKLFDWDYPLLPMDLCFYKNGYAWLSSSSHEHFAYLYFNDKQTLVDLNNMGVKIRYDRDIDDSKLFLEESLKTIIKDFNEVNHL